MPPAAKNTAFVEREGGKTGFSDFVLIIAPFIARAVILFIGATLRVSTAGSDNLKEAMKSRGSVIYAFWHNMMLPMAFMLRDKRIHIMVSRSRDGEIISRIVNRLGAVPVRGSTGRGGAGALVKIIRAVKQGEDAAITPDGPQGPAFKAKPGTARLAAATSSPVLPAAFSSSKRIILSSWDRFIIPIPFSRAVMVYGKPVHVSEHDDIREKTDEIENALKSAAQLAESCFRRA